MGDAAFFKIEGDQIATRYVSRVEADTLFVDLRVTGGVGLTGDLNAGFEFTAYLRFNRFPLGRVQVTPVSRDAVPEDVQRRLA